VWSLVVPLETVLLVVWPLLALAVLTLRCHDYAV